MRLPPLPVLILAILTATAQARSETVVLSTGERLDAQSVAVDGQTVVIQHKVLGTLKVPLKDIRSIDGRLIVITGKDDSAPDSTASPAATKNSGLRSSSSDRS